MKKFFRNLILLAVLGILVYQYRTNITDELVSLRDRALNIFIAAPCSKPIPYTLGAFDSKFNISKTSFLAALASAEGVWEHAYGKELFTYSPADTDTDVLKVNLIYDYRQQATEKLASLGIAVQDTKASYDALKAKYTALKTQYEAEKAKFESDLAAYNKRKGTEAERTQLMATQTDLNNKANEINSMVVVLNRMVDSLNLSVAKYNTTNNTRGESFEEGLYQSDGVTREIDIYEFSSQDKLVRVLAHELGHALGLEHVDDPKAIMYKLNQGSNLTPTATDIAALNAKCGMAVEQ